MSLPRCLAGLIGIAVGAGFDQAPCLGQSYSVHAGDIVIANYNKGSIVRIDPTTGTQQRLGGTFAVPTDLTLHPSGAVYVSEWQGAVKRLDLADGTVTTVLPSGSGPAQVWGIALARSGDLFVTSRANHGVYRVDPITGSAALVTQGNLLYTPIGIDFLDPDHLLVSCLLTNRLVSISLADGSQSTIAEGGGLDQPWGVAVSGGTVYVTAYDRKELQRVSDGTVSKVASMADFPYGLGIDLSGNLVIGLKGVAETVGQVSPQGTLLNTYAGPLIGQATGVEVAQSNLPAQTDTDADGLLDWQETIAGTDPLDAASVLRASVSAESGVPVRLVWPSVVGRVYSVLEADSVLDGFTVMAQTLPATPPVNSWTPTSPAPAHRFYRVAVQRLK